MIDYSDVLRQVVGLFQVVRGKHDGQPILARKPGDLAPHVRSRLWIQTGRRFIQEQHLRLVDESHRYVELALHATGEGARNARAGVQEVEAFEQTVNAPPQPGTREAIELTLQCQVLSRRCLQVNRRLLRDDTDHAPHTPRLLYDIPPHNGSAASRGP